MKNIIEPRWNSDFPVKVSPEDYERQVVAWLNESGKAFRDFSIVHLKKISGIGGDYSIDGWAEFEVFDGAKVKVLVECKRHARAVERDVVLAVHAKKQAVNAHKAMIFSTSGFQKGAVELASNVGIALVVFVSGKMTYMTRSAEPTSEFSYPPDLPKFAGQLLRMSGATTSVSYIGKDRLAPLVGWLEA